MIFHCFSSWSRQPLYLYIILRPVNKSCYNDSFCLQEYTKTIGLKRKRHLFGAEKLKWFLLFSGIEISGKYLSAKLLRMCKSKKKSDIVATFRYIPSSVKSPQLKSSLMYLQLARTCCGHSANFVFQVVSKRRLYNKDFTSCFRDIFIWK